VGVAEAVVGIHVVAKVVVEVVVGVLVEVADEIVVRVVFEVVVGVVAEIEDALVVVDNASRLLDATDWDAVTGSDFDLCSDPEKLEETKEIIN
jgi:hypothetical protein